MFQYLVVPHTALRSLGVMPLAFDAPTYVNLIHANSIPLTFQTLVPRTITWV